MDLRKYNNSYIRLTDIDNQKFQGICIFEDKDEYEEEENGLSIKTEKLDNRNQVELKKINNFS